MLISIRRVLHTLDVAINQEQVIQMKSSLRNMRNMNLVSLRHYREPPIFSVVWIFSGLISAFFPFKKISYRVKIQGLNAQMNNRLLMEETLLSLQYSILLQFCDALLVLMRSSFSFIKKGFL